MIKAVEQPQWICVAYKIDEWFQLSSHKRLNSLSFWKNSKNESEPRPFLIIIHRLFNSLQLKVGISMLLNPEIDKE